MTLLFTVQYACLKHPVYYVKKTLQGLRNSEAPKICPWASRVSLWCHIQLRPQPPAQLHSNSLASAPKSAFSDGPPAWLQFCTSIPETEPLQSPTTKVKLECNHTARLYRKHFLGKVGWPAGLGVPGWVRRGSPRSPGGGGWAGQPSRESREHVSWIRSFNQQTRMAPRRHDGVVVSRVCL